MANYNIDAIYNGNTSLPGTERVRIDSSGNIGIGTATPSTKLHIYENANRVTYISQNDNHIARFEAYGTATAIDTTASNGIFFRISSGDIVKFAADGNVGIGTSTAGAPLHIYRASNPWIRVNGGGAFSYIQLDDGSSYGYLFKNGTSNTNNGALAGAMYTYTDSGKAFQHIHSGTPLFTILSGGNVGIGTTSPAYKLDVAGSVYGSNYFSVLTAATYGPSDNSAAMQVFGSTGSGGLTNTIKFVTGGSERVRIDSGGNVGVGITSLIHKIQAAGLISAGDATYNNDSTFIGAILNNDGTNPGLDLRRWNGGAAGTNNHGATYIATNSTGDTLFYNGLIAANTRATSEKMRISVGGNVGIGTSSPSSKLHVWTGTVQVSGFQSIAGGPLTFLRSDYNGSAAVQINFLNINPSNGFDSDLGIQLMNTGGSMVDVLRIKGSTGNVGIGTTSPSVKLTVSGDVTDSDVGQFRAVGSTSAAKMINVGYHTTNNYGFISALIAGTGYSALSLQPNGGNVGIGTTSPGCKFAVIGETQISSSSAYTTHLNYNDAGTNFITTANTGYTYFRGSSNNVTTMAVYGGGGVSVGTGSLESGCILTVRASNSARMSVTDGTTRAHFWPTGGAFYISTETNSPMVFITNAGERMRIATDGNVGIGTSSPGVKLDVVGGVRSFSSSGNYGLITNGSFQAVGDHGGTYMLDLDNTGAADLVNIKKSGTSRFYITNGGNVGIGTTSPAHKLEVYNTADSPTYVRINNQNSGASAYTGVDLQSYGGGWQVRVPASTIFANSLQFSFNDAERVRITYDGNVGIGTTSPITKLHVAGTTSIIPTYDSGSGYSYFLRMGYDTSGSYDYTIKRNGTTGFLEFNGTQGSTYVSYVFAGGDVYSGASGGTIGGFYFNSSSHGIRRATGTNDVYCFTTSGTLYLGAGGSSTTHVRVLSGGDVGIGVSPSYKLDVNGNIHGTGFPTSSDVRFKKNITPLQNSLEKIKKLQGVKYEWNEFVNSRRDGYKLNIPIIGLIAQDVEQVVPEIVDHWKLSEDCQDARSIDYPRLIPLLIEAMKEQQNQIEELRNEIKSLKSN